MKLYLTAIIKSKPEFSEEVKAVLQNMVVQTRKEIACIGYDLHQGIEDKNLFVVYEIWAHQKGLDLHNQQPYFKAFRAIVSTKLQQEPVLLLTHQL